MTTHNNVLRYGTVIIGAGFAGIGLGAQLLTKGDTDFVILERGSDVGGTWRDNHYPGAACDVPSHLYSYSFHLNPRWSRMFAEQPEILDYIRDVARSSGVQEHVRLNEEVLEARWDNEAERWLVKTTAGSYEAAALVSAVGHLSEPKFPAIPGWNDFAGDVFHSAQWDDDVDLAGRRVAVIGSGASAIQIVPELGKLTGHLTVFQRSAPYISARHDHEFSGAEKGLFERHPRSMEELRAQLFWANEERYAQRRGTPSLVEAVTRSALDHLASQIPDGMLRDQLTPDYTLGCKRVLKSMDYYPTFLRENVSLVTEGIVSVEAGGIRTTDDVLHEVDVIVACTGFEATDLPIAYRTFGRAGRALSEAWAGGMEAFATTAVHGFPNFWVINGPNTGLGHNSAIYIAESQISYILEALEHVHATGDVLDVSARLQAEYMDRVDSLAQGTVWLDGGCRSWYVDARNNRLTTLWPDLAFTFREVNSVFDPQTYERAFQAVGA